MWAFVGKSVAVGLEAGERVWRLAGLERAEGGKGVCADKAIVVGCVT